MSSYPGQEYFEGSVEDLGSNKNEGSSERYDENIVSIKLISNSKQ
jgi:hypothetical protein